MDGHDETTGYDPSLLDDFSLIIARQRAADCGNLWWYAVLSKEVERRVLAILAALGG
jgi:hypothetical protein